MAEFAVTVTLSRLVSPSESLTVSSNVSVDTTVSVNVGRAAAAEIFCVDRRHICIAGDRERPAGKRRVGTPNDGQAKGPGNGSLFLKHNPVAVQHIPRHRPHGKRRPASVQVDVVVG